MWLNPISKASLLYKLSFDLLDDKTQSEVLWWNVFMIDILLITYLIAVSTTFWKAASSVTTSSEKFSIKYIVIGFPFISFE